MNNNNYYEPQHDEVEEKERFDHKVFQMLRTEEYDPADSFKMGEAIQNASTENAEIIQDLVEKRDWANLGRKLYNMSYEYQESFAESELYRTNEF